MIWEIVFNASEKQMRKTECISSCYLHRSYGGRIKHLESSPFTTKLSFNLYTVNNKAIIKEKNNAEKKCEKFILRNVWASVLTFIWSNATTVFWSNFTLFREGIFGYRWLKWVSMTFFAFIFRAISNAWLVVLKQRLWWNILVNLLTYIRSMLPIYTPWKHKISGFLKFSGGIDRKNWSEMG